MKSRLDSESLRIITILKLDAQSLYQRIKEREREYVGVFASKRTREHFPSVFKNRYDGTSLNDLKKCSEDVIIALNNFHTVVDEMRWYLMITEDMPATVTDKLEALMRDLDDYFEPLMLLLDAELGIQPERPGLLESSGEVDVELD